MSVTPPTPHSRPERRPRPAQPTPLRPRTPRPAPSVRDVAELSADARALVEAARAVHDADEARAELILRIRQQIAEGGYEPDAEAVARALLDQLQS